MSDQVQVAKARGSTQATVGATGGVAASQILVWYGTQAHVGWFVFESPTEEGVIIGAIATLMTIGGALLTRLLK